MMTAIAASLFTLAGCARSDKNAVPGKIDVVAGDQMLLVPGEESSNPVVLEVLTDYTGGFLGGKGTRKPCANVTVLFESSDPARLGFLDTPGSAPKPSLRAPTDAGGHVRVYLRTAGKIGSIRYTATVINADGKPVKVKDKPLSVILEVNSGLTVTAPKQIPAKTKAKTPLVVTLKDALGRPVPGANVNFNVIPGKAGKVSNPRTQTDSTGQAATGFIAGKGTGKTAVQVQVDGFDVFPVKIFHYDVLQIIIGVLAGLAIFLYGMNAMSSGLKEIAGERIRKVLQVLTTNRWSGLVVGTLVTAVIQSSSATTVMVVGFVNAGLMQLEQAVSLVIGANIGTTVTAQLISFKLTHLALPTIALGVLITLAGRSRSMKNWGKVLAGFGFLFYGLHMMSSELKPLAASQTVINSLKWMDCTPDATGSIPTFAPIFALIVGTMITMVIQSSSASIGLLLAMSSAGLVNFYTAVPILFGDNIGTTITANLAAIGANTAARRSAIAHAMFNLLGVAIMMPLFYVTIYTGGRYVPIYLHIIDLTVAGNPFSATHENIARHIANAHTLFNVINAGVFIFLIGPLTRLATKLIPEREGAQRQTYLEPRFLNTPPLALALVVRELGYMAQLTRKSFNQSLECLIQADINKWDKLQRREQKIDEKHIGITDYLSTLTEQELSSEQSKCIPLMLHGANDFERIGDHCENILALARRRIDEHIEFSPTALADLMDIQEQILNVYDKLLAAILEDNLQEAIEGLKAESRLKKMLANMDKEHAARQETGVCPPTAAALYNGIQTHLERIVGHLINTLEVFVELHHWRELSDPAYPDATRRKTRESQGVMVAGLESPKEISADGTAPSPGAQSPNDAVPKPEVDSDADSDPESV